jgi:hypothetical protein
MYFKNIVFNLSNLFLEEKEKSILFFKELYNYAKKNEIEVYFVSGYKEKNTKELIFQLGLENFKNIYFVDDSYLKSLPEIDNLIRSDKYLKNKDYFDDYYKVFFLTKQKFKLNTKNTLFIGSDIWTDAYYISEYTSANVILLNQFLTFNNKKYLKTLKTINTIDLKFKEFENLLEKEVDFDYSNLKTFAKKYLLQESIGKIDLNLDFKKLFKK